MTYDYYGAYDNKLNKHYEYRDKLEQDYTFGFPQHHAKVYITKF